MTDPTSTPAQDLHLTATGAWEPISVFADMPDNVTGAEFLRQQGWDEFFDVGQRDAYLAIRTWRNMSGDGPARYMLTVEDVNAWGPHIIVDSFPAFMDLLARWAPAVQAAGIGGLIGDISSGDLSNYGIVERVAARAFHGVEYTHSAMEREQQRRREERARRRQA